MSNAMPVQPAGSARAAAPERALATASPSPAPADRPRPRSRIEAEEFFGHQPASTSSLPSPEPLLENLTRCVIEILAGARDLEQISRWVTDDVYRHLLKRVVISARARHAKHQPVVRPTFAIGSTTMCEPRDGAVEAVVIVRGRARTRAVAIRLEGLDDRWRATAINVL
ncbi:Rv3235 family protein [Marisediminicola sp. LYQ134]|uniref:Rv3235 family protein n=1 Tax=unclassified Marisediminicola TaxID=2618316 RepID=UPI003983D977